MGMSKKKLRDNYSDRTAYLLVREAHFPEYAGTTYYRSMALCTTLDKAKSISYLEGGRGKWTRDTSHAGEVSYTRPDSFAMPTSSAIHRIIMMSFRDYGRYLDTRVAIVRVK